MAPLQKRALYSLVIGFVLAVVLIVVIIAKGISAFYEDYEFRLIVYALWVGVPLVYLVMINLTMKKPGQVDERDKVFQRNC